MTDIKQRLNAVEEQTKLLLDKQLEAKKYCDESFSDLLSLIDQKVQEADEQADDYKSLIRIHDLISKQYSSFGADVEDDIQFLKEQLKAVQSIKAVKDDKKAEELFNSILEEDEELLETSEFSKNLEEEAAESKKGFISIMEDIKNSLLEGNLEELEAVLNTMMKEQKEKEQGEGQDIFEDDECCDDDCDSCCSNCPSKDEDCGADIFSGLFDDDKEDE